MLASANRCISARAQHMIVNRARSLGCGIRSGNQIRGRLYIRLVRRHFSAADVSPIGCNMCPYPVSPSIEDFLLPPRSGSETRLCTFGEPIAVGSIDPGVITLSVRRGDPSSFATLALLLSELRQLPMSTVDRLGLSKLSAEIDRLRAAEQALAPQQTLDGAALASRGALAALRRVTRESAEIAIITDRAARILTQILALPAVRYVVVPSVDEIDRPSLKALVRACLIAKPETSPVWKWYFSAAPEGPKAPNETMCLNELAREVHAEMLRTILSILRLTRRGVAAGASMVGQSNASPFLHCGVGIACSWLTTQNYDAAIRWAVDALANERNVDALRVLAVAATNTGRHDLAIQAFREAYYISKIATRRAHLCSMQALIIAKRKYDLVESQHWYEQGLAELACGAQSDDGDPAIEEAWIYNGLALNKLLEARFSGRPIGTAFDATFDLLRRAFELVQEGGTSDHVYLRYNLLGNMSVFMNLQGEHRIARDLFERAFDSSLTEGLADALEWRAVLTTRRAGLCASAGETEAALGLYRDAVGMLVETDRPACAETVRRSLGILTLRLGRAREAEVVFHEGLAEALQARSLLGAKVHGAGLVYALVCQGLVSAAADALRALGETEGVWLSDPGVEAKVAALSVTPPTHLFGLSTSIPEIDLENLEPVNISGVLSGSETVPHVATGRI
jgi:tetratricopeptide (TPR) repeat protein